MGLTFSLPSEGIWPELIGFVLIVIAYLRQYSPSRLQHHSMFYFFQTSGTDYSVNHTRDSWPSIIVGPCKALPVLTVSP